MFSSICGVVSSRILSLVTPMKTMLLWSDGDAISICVRYVIETVLSGEKIAPPLAGKCDVFLHISHMLPSLYSKRSSDSGSHHHFLLSRPCVWQVPSINDIFMPSNYPSWMAAVQIFISGWPSFYLGHTYLLHLFGARKLSDSGQSLWPPPVAIYFHVTTWWWSLNLISCNSFIHWYPVT